MKSIKNILKHILPRLALNANKGEGRMLSQMREIKSLLLEFHKESYKSKSRSLINERIAEDINVHIMNNDKFAKPYVSFINENFEMNQHLFLVFRLHGIYPFPESENVCEVSSLEGIHLNNAKRIFFHSIWSDEQVSRLYFEPRLLKKSVWIVWGADLYNAPRERKHDYVRSHFSCYCSGADEQIIRERYNREGVFADVGGYLFPVSKSILDGTKKVPHNEIVIQINNSADKSTLEVLDYLEKFKNENIKIWTVVSYGDLQWKNAIIERGKTLFASKFEVLDKYVPPEEYVNYIANNDILILNQHRQQGVGNTTANLYLGNKVFIRSDVSTFNYFKAKGIELYDTLDIPNLSFEEFVKMDLIKARKNKLLISETIDEKKLAEKWATLF